MLKKILNGLKWTGLSLAALLIIATIVVAMRQDLKYDAPYPNITASTDPAVIEHGRQLVLGPAHCAACHGPKNWEELMKQGKDVPLSGGYTFRLPVGNFYVRNITPDPETGIGKKTDGELARVLRYGVLSDGKAALPFMPFHDVSDEDLTAIISYLRAQQPVKNKVPKHEPNVMGNVLLAFMIRPQGPSGAIIPKIKRDTSAAYGRYLIFNVANCNGCHTRRNISGDILGEPFAGGSPMQEIPDKPALTPPNISGDSASRILGWSEQDFINRFRMGKIIDYSPMPWTSFARMSDEDLKAIFHYLKSVRSHQSAPNAVMAKK